MNAVRLATEMKLFQIVPSTLDEESKTYVQTIFSNIVVIWLICFTLK